jgi:tyrosyl-tRNA synthetase
MDKLAHNDSDVCTNEILRLVAAIWNYNSELLHKFKVIAMIAAVCDESTASRVVETLSVCARARSMEVLLS